MLGGTAGGAIADGGIPDGAIPDGLNSGLVGILGRDCVGVDAHGL